MSRFVVGLVFAAGLAAPSRALAQPSAEDALQRAITAHSKLKTLRATFTRSVTNPLTGSEVKTRGVVMRGLPSQLSVRFTNPTGDLIVADGKWIWVYLPSTNPGQVIKMPVGENGAGAADVAAMFLPSPKLQYVVTDSGTGNVAGRRSRVLILIPRAGTSAPFARATVWIDTRDGLLRQFETVEANGVVSRVTLTSLTPNAKFDGSTFMFTPPKGVKIFEQGTR
ncbi:MAG: outer membrane lipoprotein carrier protein LolA [Gemmatimonadaceae bacterium]